MSQRGKAVSTPLPPPVTRTAQRSISVGNAEAAELQNPVGNVHGAGSPNVEGAPGTVAAAIQSLPLDVGTAISPTLPGLPSNTGSLVCKGGPGNPKCGLEVKNNQQGIQCDLCSVWFHAFCQDVPKSAYNALGKHSCIAFICDGCKRLPSLEKLLPRSTKSVAIQTFLVPEVDDANPTPRHDSILVESSVQTEGPTDKLGLSSSTPDHGEILPQLVDRVIGLEKTLKDHTAVLSQMLPKSEIDQHPSGETASNGDKQASFAEVLKASSGKPFTSAVPQAGRSVTPGPGPLQRQASSKDYRQAVREELLELEERRKRRASLVIRGLHASSVADAVAKFRIITQDLIGEQVNLSEACRIRNDADLFRGNVHEPRLRRLILDHARELKDSRYSQVYIRRDLTFQQREDLKARRLANPTFSYPRSGQSMADRQQKTRNRDTYKHPPTHDQDMHKHQSQDQDTTPKQVWTPHDSEHTKVNSPSSEQVDSQSADKVTAATETAPCTNTSQNTSQGDTAVSEEACHSHQDSDDGIISSNHGSKMTTVVDAPLNPNKQTNKQRSPDQGEEVLPQNPPENSEVQGN